MLDRTLSHYRIESRLGEGGMGVVYLARDLALGRSAALKVVANNVDSDLRDRLLRERGGERAPAASGDRHLL